MKYIIINVFIFSLLILAGGCTEPLVDSPGGSDAAGGTCAAVNSVFIPQQRLDDLVVAAYGKKVLDDMVLLELVVQYAGEKGVVLTDEMYNAELDSFLEEIAPGKDRGDQEAIFAYMLRKRNISREIFDLILQKQALLKAVIDTNVVITEPLLEAEFARQYGQQRTIRLIAVNSLRKIENVEVLLASGNNFVTVAREHSEDEQSLRSDALAGPFSIADDYYAPELVAHTFAMKAAGDISESFMFTEGTNQRWCKLQLETIIPAQDKKMADCRSELEKIVSRKEVNKRINNLQDKLQKQARIVIMDKRVKARQ